ncbi:all trans-polyprenyl-diphosphate synthase PDSS1-like isoform X1 [Acropora millepora]|uniref:all trans-polyprenyl-diphosphate synthase PDSS1-like isoform X1 n=1 Tax=Acropora millepora TaxID=45264 RepID=UPI001CF4E613|nr:all trans-polyprenyl-diphosphate synthase PDSS1-like isoform X1 [Acropora millepora]
MAAASNLSSCARLSWTKQCISRSSTILVKTYERACLRHMFRRCSFSIFACHSTLAQSIPECIFSRSAVKTHPRTYRRILQSSSYYPDHLYLSRFCSSSSPLHISQSDPQVLTETFLSHLCDRIRKELNTSINSLREVSHYYFDGNGKYIRPMIVLLAAGACNKHTGNKSKILQSQETVVMVSEMIHTASLIHDDVIDGANTRRGKVSVNTKFGEKMSVLAADYILSCASKTLAQLGNAEVVKLLAKVVDDLIKGEFMQLGSKENPDERFNHYLEKTYKKTASLVACCCRAVAVFGDSPPEVQEIAYQYGRNVGMAFQVVDDILDFIATDKEMGKPTATDLQLGLATAPVLFACEQFPELNALIMRRFKGPNDVEEARQAVHKSDGIARSYTLASQYTKEAVKQIHKLSASPERDALISITHKVLQRRK